MVSAITAPLLAAMSAPPNPCTSRKTTMESSFQASAHSADPTMNTTKPASYIRTRPKISPSLPIWVAHRVIMSRYPMITQMTEVMPTCRELRISGRARITMVVSTAAMRTPVTMTTRANPVRSVTGACASGLADGAVCIRPSYDRAEPARPGGQAAAKCANVVSMFSRFDADTHLYETRDLWARYIDPAQRHDAIEIVDDALGNAWLTQAGRRIDLAEIHHPGDLDAMGVYRERVRHGLGPEVPFDEELPREFWDPALRLGQLDEFGLDASVLFPNYGLLWERPLADRLDATLANMRAWNRWTVEVASTGGGRLFPVAHVSLRRLDW